MSSDNIIPLQEYIERYGDDPLIKEIAKRIKAGHYTKEQLKEIHLLLEMRLGKKDRDQHDPKTQ